MTNDRELSPNMVSVAGAVARFGALVAAGESDKAERYVQALNDVDTAMPMKMAVAMAGVLAATMDVPNKSFQMLADALPEIPPRERHTLRALGDEVDKGDPLQTYNWWTTQLTANQRGGLLASLALHVGAAMLAARQVHAQRSKASEN